MIGILVPMPQEIELILKQMEVEKIVEAGMRKYYIGYLNQRQVVVALSRIGKVASAVTAAYMITHFDIVQLIVLGVAGGADENVKIGDICIATSSIQHDMDARGLFPQHEIPLLGVKYFVSDQNLVEKAIKAASKLVEKTKKEAEYRNILSEIKLDNIQIHAGVLASGDQFVGSSEKLHLIRKGIPELLFVEMEGAAVAQVCYEYQIKLLSVRIISDNANDSAHIDFEIFIEKVAKHLTLGFITEYLSDL
jgi:adenosylhomocysteine nucleosidase